MISKGYSVRVGKICIERNLTISCAESCTGGYLGHLITNVPGSSAYFKGGVICYSNWVKNKILAVGLGALEKNGPVSREVARILAKNIKTKFHTDIGLAIVGVAGPLRDEKKNPVGTVFIGIDFRNKTRTYKFRFRDERLSIKRKGAYKTLELLWHILRQWVR